MTVSSGPPACGSVCCRRGIVGLGTAIILIAFAISVFALAALYTGLFSSRQNEQTMYSGLQQASSALEPWSSVFAFRGLVGGTETVYKIAFLVTNPAGGEPIDLTPPYTIDESGRDPDVSRGAEYVTTVSYRDDKRFLPDVPWTVTWVESAPGGHLFVRNAKADNLLEANEKAEITAWLLNRNTAVPIGAADSVAYMDDTGDGGGPAGITHDDGGITAADEFVVEMKAPQGTLLVIKRALPARLDTAMDLR